MITPFYLPFQNVIVNGDVVETLKYVPNETFHLTFTSPPYYNARDYSTYPDYKTYLLFLDKVFREIHRTTKEGRFLVVNTSPVITPRINRQHQSTRHPIPFDLHCYLSKMGWDFTDDIIWLKPESSVKNRVASFDSHRKPLAYKPNCVTEYVMVYRKHTDRLIDWNMRQYDAKTVDNSKVGDGYETTNVWEICPKSDKVHSAVFPLSLAERVISYYSYKGDLVFDPFAGSGTTGKAAKKLRRKFFMTEKEQKYFDYMKTFFQENSLIEEEHTNFLTMEQFTESLKL